jgi:hypothetical protein
LRNYLNQKKAEYWLKEFIQTGQKATLDLDFRPLPNMVNNFCILPETVNRKESSINNLLIVQKF